jgi:hypothetical protein
LQNLTEISTVKYTTEGQARMIDLKKELAARLANKAIKEPHESWAVRVGSSGKDSWREITG